MTRISLLLAMVFMATACSQPSDAGDLGPSSARENEDPVEPRPVEVEFRFARVVERHPALDRLVDFVKADGAAADEFDGIQLSEQPGSDAHEVVLEGADRAAVEGYLQSVFSRNPELELPEELDLAFGSAPGRDPRTPLIRAYWLERESQIEVTTIRRAEVVEDNFGRQAVQLTLGERDQETFGQLTTDAVGHKIAIVRIDEVISAPVVNEPITGGDLRISMGNPSAQDGLDETDALVRELLGGAADPASAEEDSIDGLRWMWNRWNEPSP